MKLKKLRAALQERPWLMKSIGHLTGVHPYYVQKNGGIWEKHLEAWSVRNIAEITVRRFADLKLDERAEFVRTKFGPLDEKVVMIDGNGYTIRRFEAFTHTEYHAFGRSTYQVGHLDPYSSYWVVGTIYADGSINTVREVLQQMRRPHYLEERVVEVPNIFDAVVRITKVGVVSRCSSTIIDIFPFPADFDQGSI